MQRIRRRGCAVLFATVLVCIVGDSADASRPDFIRVDSNDLSYEESRQQRMDEVGNKRYLRRNSQVGANGLPPRSVIRAQKLNPMIQSRSGISAYVTLPELNSVTNEELMMEEELFHSDLFLRLGFGLRMSLSMSMPSQLVSQYIL